MQLALGALAIALSLGAASACGEPEPLPPPPALDPTELDFAPRLAVDLASMTRTASGLYVKDVYLGGGREARPGRSLTVHYTGWLHDGTRFDSSVERDEPLELVLGESSLIQGWHEGLEGMREGSRRKLVIPPHLAYGPEGAGGRIPPQATLVFSVELLDVR